MMPGIKQPHEYADDLDLMLFRSATQLHRLYEMTGDEALARASRIVGSQRPQVRAHMTATRRVETDGT